MKYSNQNTKNDRWIIKYIFPGEKSKYFIEAGACNGIQQSSCYALEEYLHWTGICIEPNSDYFQKLKKNRKNSICENLCLSESKGIVTYLKGENDKVHPMLGGIKSNLLQYRQDSQEIINHGKEISIESITLYELLQKHNAPKTIHYLAMDIEGSELPVLEVFPFDQYQILAISIEGMQCNDLLYSKGYINVVNPFNTDKLYEQYFVHKSIAVEKNLEITANHYVCMGKDLFNQHKFSQSIEAYWRAINIDPQNPNIYKLLGLAQQQNNNLSAAIDSYQEAIELLPQAEAWIYRNLAYTLQQYGNNEEAIKAYYQAIELSSQTPFWVYQSFGIALSNQKRWQEAIKFFKIASKLEPDNLLIEKSLAEIEAHI